jgi:hypothetical protein
MSVLQGGKFGHGFVSAGLTKGLTPAISGIDAMQINDYSAAQAVMAAMIGGTISEATGGKFANGAMTAAIGNVFNAQTNQISAREVAQKVFNRKSPNVSTETSAGVGLSITNNISRLGIEAGSIEYDTNGFLSYKTPGIVDDLSVSIPLGKGPISAELSFMPQNGQVRATAVGSLGIVEISSWVEVKVEGMGAWIDDAYQKASWRLYCELGGCRK